ncbi:kinesin-like protein KIF23 isoform X3 [Haliotis rufescens]|uniref:kinesin-like protein KIF23 isoform X3 n=1 Tax=Haliotis rufescens TaxID=6454 RepID=UPI001EB078CB|nr:kinesin-like protein KIF23 isoform X3 [Haliotis rufescens]
MKRVYFEDPRTPTKQDICTRMVWERLKRRRGKTPRKRNGTQQFDPVEVYCRIRPLENPEEPLCVKVLNNKVVELTPSETAVNRNGQAKEIQYTFQHIFDEYTSQKAIYDYVALPLIEDLIHGKNGLLFTYGITSSGKTFTMTGSPQDQGILPRCLDVLFNSIEGYQAKKYIFRPDKMNAFEVCTEADAMMERQRREILPGLTTPKTPSTPRHTERVAFGGDSGRNRDPSKVGNIEQDNNYGVFVSYIEIYNNFVYDLLEELPYDPITGYKPPQSKILRTDMTENMYVHNCVEVEVKSPEDAFEVLYKGQKRRKVAHTALNAESSRSHSVFNIRLVQAPVDPRGGDILQDPEYVVVSQLSLVDLAGSERTNRTKNSGERLKEAGNINQSLMVLRNCIEALRENQTNGTSKMVPYRDSKVTHLFKNYFDGEGKVRMVVCVNPKAEEYDETIHVMKFAEMAQEVMVTRQQQVQFSVRNQQLKDAMAEAEAAKKVEAAPLPALDYCLGPSFPPTELLHAGDDKTLFTMGCFLEERYKRRHTLILDLTRREDDFRAELVEMEREYTEMQTRLEELETMMTKKDRDLQKLETKNRQLEKKNTDLSRRNQDLERESQTLGLKLQDKNWKIQVEKTEKEKMKSDFRNRLDMHSQQWEKNMEKERRKVAVQAGAEIQERDRKLKMLENIVNQNSKPMVTPRRPAPKPRTYTTPGYITPARSDTDVSRVGVGGTGRMTRATAAGVGSAKSMYNLNHVSSTAKPRPPAYNTRNHRRSKSSSNAEVWLDHRPNGDVEMDSVLQPKMGKKRSVSKLELKDTKEASKYVLTTHEMDSEGEMATKLVKGTVMPTAGGGTAVVFNDVETLRHTAPGTRKRRSSCPQPQDFDGDWTDTETRCNIALEGHGKRTKASAV